jgi:nitrate/nitrite transporter NarK
LFAGQSVFWAIVPNVLSPNARPVGIAFISMCGIFGSLISPVVIGFLKDLTGGWAAGFLFTAIMLVLSVSVVVLLSVQQRSAVAVRQPASESAHAG